MKVGRWSTTAGNNNGTPPDGFPEGQVTSTFNDGMREVMAAVKTALQDIDYFDHALTPTYATANSFTLAGDQTARLNAGRQLKLFDGSTIYRSVLTASFTAVTTVQLASGTAITTSLSAFAIGVLNPARFSYPPASAFVMFDYILNAVSGLGQNYNVASVGFSSTAMVKVSFTTAFTSANYVPCIYVPNPGGNVVPAIQNYTATTTYCKFLIKDSNGVGQPVVTAAEVNCVFFGS
jgi:hypothetical protein